jgi:hypothetical protein
VAGGRWQVAAVLLLSSFVVENILLTNMWKVLVKPLSYLAYITVVKLVPRSLVFSVFSCVQFAFPFNMHTGAHNKRQGDQITSYRP